MAVVDFSNAQIEYINPVSSVGDIAVITNLADANYGFTANTSSTTSIVTGLVRTRYDIDKTHSYILYTGTFNASGTEIIYHHLNWSTAEYAYYRISNISFNTGDTFSFRIDVTYTFND